MMKKGFLVVCISAGMAAQASAVNAGASTQDLLIQKLTQVQLNLAPADPARAAVLLRLADLHAERARQASMQELNEGCTVCTAGQKDREKALGFYAEALAKVPASQTAKVHLQMGHLYELQGQGALAEKSYQSMLTGSSSPLNQAEANLSLAEMAFRKNDFKKAYDLYDKVLKTEGASSQGLAAYRKGWSAFRLGQMNEALLQFEEILKNPKLQSRMASARAVADVQFLEEVSRDMATVMAARGLQDQDAQRLYDLSPEQFKLQQVTLLAREGTRLGQKEASLKTWEFVYQKQTEPKARMEAQVNKAQLYFDLKNIDSGAAAFNNALALWSGASCSLENCAEAAKGLRQYVVGWNRLESSKPSTALLSAYEGYLKTFPQDEEMFIWGAQAAAQAGQYTSAAQWSGQASTLLLAHYNNESAVNKKKEWAEKLEKNLLLGIEDAEKAKDAQLLAQAQDAYLQKSILKQKTFDVQYQKAYAVYQKADYQQAALQLHELALKPEGTRAIRVQAAELSLDALALLKDDARMQEWSGKYAGQFAEKKQDFQKIQQKSILTQSAKLAEAQPEQALVAMADFDMAAATAEDRKVFLKNKILLNEKLNRITEARSAVEDLLRETTLTPEDREFALGRKLWFAELELDFATALKAAEQMKFASLSADEKILKLALYTELADKDPKAYYNQYLKQSQDQEKKALIAMQLVQLSATPGKELETLRPFFRVNPGLYARAALNIYAQTADKKILTSALKEKGDSKQDSFVMIEKILLLSDLKALESKVAVHKIDSQNQSKLARSLKERVNLMTQLDGIANRAIASGDWSGQLLSLDLVAKENRRFYEEVLSLPLPEGLTAEQEQEYLMLLSQQVAPNQNTADMAAAKTKEFWSQGTALEKYKAFAEQDTQWRPFILEEVEAVAQIAPEEQKVAWSSFVSELKGANSPTQKPTLAELEQARRHLRQNPFALSALQEVLALEKKAERRSMVEYIESRIATLAKKDMEKQQ